MVVFATEILAANDKYLTANKIDILELQMYDIGDYEDQVSFVSVKSTSSSIDLNEIQSFHNTLLTTYESIILRNLNRPSESSEANNPTILAKLCHFSPRKSSGSLHLYSNRSIVDSLNNKLGNKSYIRKFYEVFPMKRYESQVSFNLQNQCQTSTNSSNIKLTAPIPSNLNHPSLIKIYNQAITESAKLENEAFSPNTHRQTIADIPNIDELPKKHQFFKQNHQENVKTSLQHYFTNLNPPVTKNSNEVWKLPKRLGKSTKSHLSSCIRKINSIHVHFNHTPIKYKTLLEQEVQDSDDTISIVSDIEVKLSTIKSSLFRSYMKKQNP